MPSHCRCTLRLASADRTAHHSRAGSLASRPRLRVSRSLRIDRRGTHRAWHTAARSGSLAGAAMPSHRLRNRCASRRPGTASMTADRHGSLASRRPLRVARSLRLAGADRTAQQPRRLARIAATPARVALAPHRPARLPSSMAHCRPVRLAGGRGDVVASPAHPLRLARSRDALHDSRPARLARVTATPAGRPFATPRRCRSHRAPPTHPMPGCRVDHGPSDRQS